MYGTKRVVSNARKAGTGSALVVMAFLAPPLNAATVSGRVTQCCGELPPAGNVDVVFEDLTLPSGECGAVD